MGRQLAIDTATDLAGLALAERGQVIAEVTWPARRNHTQELIPGLLHLLAQAKMELKELDGIIVARGPGSFTGLRVGVAVAKGLAHGLRLPLVGVSTLEVTAYQHAPTSHPICSILEAGRGEVAAALFQAPRGRWRRLRPEQILPPEEVVPWIEHRTLFCGEMSASTVALLRERLGHRAVMVKGAFGLRRAGFLAELGWRRLARRQFEDVASFAPLYLRPAAAEARPRPTNMPATADPTTAASSSEVFTAAF